ncbi:MAG: lysostaphin resistance A-like protein [Schleiferiaceae bacterium]
MNVYKNRKEPFFFLVITLGGSFAAIFFAPSALKLFGFSGMSVTEILERPEESAGRALLLYQCIGSLLMFLVPGLIMINRWKIHKINTLEKPNWGWINTLLTIILLPLLLPFMDYLSSIWNNWGQQIPLLKGIFEQYNANAQLIEKMIFFEHIGDTLFSFIVFVIFAALSEEVFFRGTIQRFLHQSLKPGQAILIGAFAFALGHLNIVQLPFLLIAGGVLGLIYWVSGRLWVSVLAHALHNGLTYFWTLSSGPGNYGTIASTQTNYALVIISCSIALAIIIKMVKTLKTI